MTESTQRKNRNGDGEVRREVGNRQGDKYGNRWGARRNLSPRAHRKNIAKERELKQLVGGKRMENKENLASHKCPERRTA